MGGHTVSRLLMVGVSRSLLFFVHDELTTLLRDTGVQFFICYQCHSNIDPTIVHASSTWPIGCILMDGSSSYTLDDDGICQKQCQESAAWMMTTKLFWDG